MIEDIDIVATLLDGAKIKKSQVPVGEIYINEKGQKVRKVLKATTNPKDIKKTIANLSQKIDGGYVKVRDGIIVAATKYDKIVEEYQESPGKLLLHTISSLPHVAVKTYDTVSYVAENTADTIREHSDTIKRVFKIIGSVFLFILKIAFILGAAALILCLILLEIFLILLMCPFFGLTRSAIKKVASWIKGEIRWIISLAKSGEKLIFKKDGDLD